MATEANIERHLGQDMTLLDTLSVTDDISAWTIRFLLAKKDGDAALLTKQTGGSGGISIDNATKLVTVTLVKAATSALLPRRYRYEIARIDAGFEAVLTYGDFNLLGRPAPA
jgi:hypothetical protein